MHVWFWRLGQIVHVVKSHGWFIFISFSSMVFENTDSVGDWKIGSGKESTCQCRRSRKHGFDPWVGKIPWRRKWQPISSSILAWRIPWTEEPGGLHTVHGVTKRRTWLSNRAHTSLLCPSHLDLEFILLCLHVLSQLLWTLESFSEVSMSRCNPLALPHKS